MKTSKLVTQACVYIFNIYSLLNEYKPTIISRIKIFANQSRDLLCILFDTSIQITTMLRFSTRTGVRYYLPPLRISSHQIVVRVDERIRTYIRYARAAALALIFSSRVHASFVISVASRACSVQKSAACTPVRLSISHLASCRKINGWPM